MGIPPDERFAYRPLGRGFGREAPAVGGEGDADAHAGVLAGEGVARDQLAGGVQALDHLALAVEHLAAVVDLDAGNGAEGAQRDLFNVEGRGFHLGGLGGGQLILQGGNRLARVGRLVVGVDGLLQLLGVDAVVPGQRLDGVVLLHVALLDLLGRWCPCRHSWRPR